MRKTRTFLAVFALTAACLAAGGPVQASDHLDGSVAAQDPVADLLDLYAFVEPYCRAQGGQGCEDDPEELILALTLHPEASGASQFSDEVAYHFYFENDLQQTFQIDCSFSPDLLITCAGMDGLSVSAQPGQVGTNGNIRVFAGLRDDPFFMDIEALQQFAVVGVPAFSPPGTDSLAGSNVLAIVIGIKTSAFPAGAGPDHNLLKVWAASERTAGAGLNGAITGSWNNSEQRGQGYAIEVVSHPSGDDQFVVYFYGYDDTGGRLWLLGSGFGIDGYTATVDVLLAEGMGFGGNFDPESFDFEFVGSMSFTFSDCNTGSVTFTPSNGDLAAFSTDITRFTAISSMDCSLLSAGQVDRVGRPGVSSLMIPEDMRNDYNSASDPATWVALFNDSIVDGLNALDRADGVVGNMAYDAETLAPIFADDRLQVDIKNGQTVDYFTNELSALVPQESFDSGGRALWYDVLDGTLSMIVSAWDPLVSDFVDENDKEFLADFPFLAPPH